LTKEDLLVKKEKETKECEEGSNSGHTRFTEHKEHHLCIKGKSVRNFLRARR